jgi:AcrR family transcriptional regulator
MAAQSTSDGVKPLHTPHGQAQQQSLVRAAVRVIAAGGLEHFRTREVARLAGVNIATLHYYFPTKEDLIRSVWDYIHDQLIYFRDPAVSMPVPTRPLEALRQEFADLLYQIEKLPEIFIVLMELALRSLRDPFIKQIMNRTSDGWHAHIEEFLSEGVRQGIFRNDIPTDVLAWDLITLLEGQIIQLLTNREAFPVERVMATIERLLLPPQANDHSQPL